MEQGGEAAGGGVRDRGCGGAQGGCAVQGAEAGDAKAAGLLAPGAHPATQGATITWVCVNTSLSRCLCRTGGQGSWLLPHGE